MIREVFATISSDRHRNAETEREDCPFDAAKCPIMSPLPSGPEDPPHRHSDDLVADQEPANSYFPRIPFRRSRDEAEGSAAQEALPLLRRPSTYLERTEEDALLDNGHSSNHVSDDGGVADGEPLVRVQSGVKKVEAITMLWTLKSLIIAYVRYSIVLSVLTTVFS